MINVFFDSPDLKRIMTDIWNNPQVEAGAKGTKKSSFAQYCHENWNRMVDDHYIPTDADILQCSVQSSVQEQFCMIDNFPFTLVDIAPMTGKQKWRHQLCNCCALIYVVDISFTGLPLRYILYIFEDLCANIPSDVTLCLVLNKVDLFRKNFEEEKLRIQFPDYSEGADVENALLFLRAKFRSVWKKTTHLQIFCITALDISQVAKIFSKNKLPQQYNVNEKI